MKKGQFSVEAAFVASIIVAFFTALIAINSSIQTEAADRRATESGLAGCDDFAKVIDATYSAGQGAETAYELRENTTIYPGMVEIGDKIYCRIEEGSTTGTKTLTAGVCRIRNTGDELEFT
jgi:hypothetical protein